VDCTSAALRPAPPGLASTQTWRMSGPKPAGTARLTAGLPAALGLVVGGAVGRAVVATVVGALVTAVLVLALVLVLVLGTGPVVVAFLVVVLVDCATVLWGAERTTVRSVFAGPVAGPVAGGEVAALLGATVGRAVEVWCVVSGPWLAAGWLLWGSEATTSTATTAKRATTPAARPREPLVGRRLLPGPGARGGGSGGSGPLGGGGGSLAACRGWYPLTATFSLTKGREARMLPAAG